MLRSDEYAAIKADYDVAVWTMLACEARLKEYLSTMHWHRLHQAIVPHVVRIESPYGSGTGFLFGYNRAGSLAAIATASHVVEQCHDWHQSIKIFHDSSGSEVFLDHGDRADTSLSLADIVADRGSVEYVS